MNNCFLYAKLIRDVISAGLGGALLYAAIRFRRQIGKAVGFALWSLVTAFVFIVSWPFGKPRAVPCTCADDDIRTPWDLDVERWRWQRNLDVTVPKWVVYVLASPFITAAIALVCVAIYLAGVALFHRYWNC